MESVTEMQANQKMKSARIFPNPGKENSWLEWFSEGRENLRISIMDGTGRQLKTLTHAVEKGRNLLPLPAQELCSGLYILSISDGLKTSMLRWAIRK
jgi:hypothetical protein